MCKEMLLNYTVIPHLFAESVIASSRSRGEGRETAQGTFNLPHSHLPGQRHKLTIGTDHALPQRAKGASISTCLRTDQSWQICIWSIVNADDYQV